MKASEFDKAEYNRRHGKKIIRYNLDVSQLGASGVE